MRRVLCMGCETDENKFSTLAPYEGILRKVCSRLQEPFALQKTSSIASCTPAHTSGMEVIIMTQQNSGSNQNQMAVPEAKAAMSRFKEEVASELGVPLKEGYNGDLTSAQAGSIGGEMVKKMIRKQEQQMSGK